MMNKKFFEKDKLKDKKDKPHLKMGKPKVNLDDLSFDISKEDAIMRKNCGTIDKSLIENITVMNSFFKQAEDTRNIINDLNNENKQNIFMNVNNNSNIEEPNIVETDNNLRTDANFTDNPEPIKTKKSKCRKNNSTYFYVIIGLVIVILVLLIFQGIMYFYSKYSDK